MSNIDINTIWDPLIKKEHHIPEIPAANNNGTWQRKQTAVAMQKKEKQWHRDPSLTTRLLA